MRAAFALLMVAGLVSACTMKDTTAPSLSGPSEAALSVVVTATPDSILQDGASQSAISVFIRDANAKAVSGQPVRLDMAVNGTVQDFGTLSARTVVTGSDGKATTTYTAPPAPPGLLGGSGNRVQIVATPTGTNFQTAASMTVDIRLVPPGVILPPAQTPTASFSFSPSSPTLGTPVQFNATASCCDIVTYSWNFGDGATATGQFASHLFTKIQTYNVTLTVTSDRGLSASTTQTLSVGRPATNTSPDFSFSPGAPAVGQSIIFDASTTTTDPNVTVVDYAWTFGDSTATQHTASKTIAHQYDAAGDYFVTLTVTDSVGLTNTKSNTVTVSGGSDPVAVFTISQTPTSPGTILTFDGGRSTPSGAASAVVRWEWDFGDGSPIDSRGDPVVTHSYSRTGSYSVKLKITDNLGRTNSTAKTLVVQ